MAELPDIDDMMYESLKALFETVMLRMVEKAANGESYHDDFALIQKTFNNNVDSLKRCAIERMSRNG